MARKHKQEDCPTDVNDAPVETTDTKTEDTKVIVKGGYSPRPGRIVHSPSSIVIISVATRTDVLNATLNPSVQIVVLDEGCVYSPTYSATGKNTVVVSSTVDQLDKDGVIAPITCT